MSKKESKTKLSANIPDAYKRISDAVYQESKKVINLLKRHQSDNEYRFMTLLDDNNIKYTFQKVFYKSMQGSRELKEKYYIAQFWLYKKQLFIEVESNRRLPAIPMNYRTYDALDVFPKAQCIKISEETLNDQEFMLTLLNIIK